MRRSKIDYTEWDRIGSELQKRFGRVFIKSNGDTPDEDGGDDNGNSEHLLDVIADRIVEAGAGKISREDAMHWLLNTPGGRALLTHVSRLKRATDRKDFTMTRDETLGLIVKRHGGVTGLCKHINATGAAAIVSEHELVALATEDAKRAYDISNGPQAFSKLYSESEPLQRALVIIKAAQLEPDATGADDAYQKLERLAADERRRSPHLSAEQAFARVFCDPVNKALATKAHQRPAATTSYPVPR
jgi:hypothetical protein